MVKAQWLIAWVQTHKTCCRLNLNLKPFTVNVSAPISPDGTQIWNGFSWVPLNQNQIYQQDLNSNLHNMPGVVTIPKKSSNALVFIILGVFFLTVISAGIIYAIDSSGDDSRSKTVKVSEFIVVEDFLWSEQGEITICNEVGDVKPKSHIACEVNIEHDSSIEISFSLESNNQTVNFLTMELEEYRKFVNGEDSEYIGRLSELDTSNFSLDSYLTPGDYVFIVHNY